MSTLEFKIAPSRSLIKRLRLAQIRASSRIASVVADRPAGQACFSALRRRRSGVRILDAILGHRRVYPTLADAQVAVSPFENFGHENPTNVAIHMDMSLLARPSDYAALFHLLPIIGEISSVYDVGGNAGNIYYSYKNYLNFRQDLKWVVYDLPGPIAYGKNLAEKRSVEQLEFTEQWSLASGVDLMLISGSLHYFEEPLAHRLQRLPKRPKHILLNRTPLTHKPTVGAIQDVGDYHVACLLLNREEVVQSLAQMGYELIDTWRCAELSFAVPANPEYNIGFYSGMMFRLK